MPWTPTHRDGVAAPCPRRCVSCGALTDDLFFDPETGSPAPALCARCREAELDVRYWLVFPDAREGGC